MPTHAGQATTHPRIPRFRLKSTSGLTGRRESAGIAGNITQEAGEVGRRRFVEMGWVPWKICQGESSPVRQAWPRGPSFLDPTRGEIGRTRCSDRLQ